MDYNSLIKRVGSTAIPYFDLLLTEEWKQKRKGILKRDKSCCQFCGTTRTINFDKCEIGIDTKDELKITTIVLENEPLEEFLKRNNTVMKVFSIDEDFTRTFGVTDNKMLLLIDWNFVGGKNYTELVINRGKSKNGYEFHFINAIGDDLSNYKFAIPKFATEQIWLHVHHRYYIHDNLPWQYNDEALITLCHICHKEYHKNEKRPIFIMQNGKLYPAEYSDCERCNGTGVIPKYSHVRNGICFGCGGRGYLQLIKVASISIDDLPVQ